MSVQMRRWCRPQLIVLCRGKPEENVLLACKVGATRLGPGNANNNCLNLKEGGSECGDQCGQQAIS
jgi:hypothetical protein